MLGMAKKKPPPPPRQPTTRAGKTLFVYVEGALRDALDALCEQTRRSLTAEVSLALEAHLRAAGLWPPPTA